MELKARKALAQRLRMLRIARGWSQEVLAELSGLHRSYIGSVERAEHNIGLDNIERIAYALEVPIEHLVGGITAPSPQPPPLPLPSMPLACTEGTAPVVQRKTFLQLVDRCRNSRQDMLLTYLECCGIKVLD